MPEKREIEKLRIENERLKAENEGLKGKFLDNDETDSYLRMVKYAGSLKLQLEILKEKLK